MVLRAIVPPTFLVEHVVCLSAPTLELPSTGSAPAHSTLVECTISCRYRAMRPLGPWSVARFCNEAVALLGFAPSTH